MSKSIRRAMLLGALFLSANAALALFNVASAKESAPFFGCSMNCGCTKNADCGSACGCGVNPFCSGGGECWTLGGT